MTFSKQTRKHLYLHCPPIQTHSAISTCKQPILSTPHHPQPGFWHLFLSYILFWLLLLHSKLSWKLATSCNMHILYLTVSLVQLFRQGSPLWFFWSGALLGLMAEVLLNSIWSMVAKGDMAYRWLQELALPTIYVSREPGKSFMAFYDLTLKVTSIIFTTVYWSN